MAVHYPQQEQALGGSEQANKDLQAYRFGLYEFDVGEHRLRRQGREVRLQEQPLQLLLYLLERPGTLVSREELRERLWSGETFVEFDDSLNTAMQKVRRVLRDDHRNPRFIETVPRQGYRFIAPVDEQAASDPEGIALDARVGLSPPSSGLSPGKLRRYLPWVTVAALLAVIFVLGTSGEDAPQASRPLRLSITPPVGVDLRPGIDGGSAISPDGETVAFVARRAGRTMLWTRRLDSLTPRELPGTENARLPFWSPDSESVAFNASGKLRMIDLAGGPPRDLASATRPTRGSWHEDGSILFSTGIPGPLLRVLETSGQATPVTLANNNSVLWPDWVVGTDQFLFFDKLRTSVRLGSLSPVNEGTELFRADSNAVFVPAASGSPAALLWMEGTRLVAQRFDEKGGRLLGEAITVMDHVGFSEGWGLVDASVSRNGVVLAGAGTTTGRRLNWLRRDGTVIDNATESDWFKSIRLSPDRTRAAVARGIRSAVWIRDFERDVFTRLTFDNESTSGWPVWSPDGNTVAYSAERGGPLNLFMRASDGTTGEERLTTSPFEQYAYDWSPDGRYLVYCEVHPTTKLDLWILPVTGNRKPYPFLKTASNDDLPQFSPDGRWIAYVSDESGRNEVYVRSFPGPHGMWQVSTAGGTAPKWSPDSNELFYLTADGHLTAVSFTPQATEFEWLAPSRLPIEPHGGGSYDIGPGGETFLLLQPDDEFRPNELVVLFNWQGALRD